MPGRTAGDAANHCRHSRPEQFTHEMSVLCLDLPAHSGREILRKSGLFINEHHKTKMFHNTEKNVQSSTGVYGLLGSIGKAALERTRGKMLMALHDTVTDEYLSAVDGISIARAPQREVTEPHHHAWNFSSVNDFNRFQTRHHAAYSWNTLQREAVDLAAQLRN